MNDPLLAGKNRVKVRRPFLRGPDSVQGQSIAMKLSKFDVCRVRVRSKQSGFPLLSFAILLTQI